MLTIDNLEVAIDGKKILNGINLSVKSGEIHAIMGPNGSGKSTLAYSIMGHPSYKIIRGSVTLDGQELQELVPSKRAHAGLFLAFQYPQAIPGVSVLNFLRSAYNAKPENKKMSIIKFQKLVENEMAKLKINKQFADRYLNDGFSGGEKKKMEILQMSVLQPKYAILDETDSGLDIDSLKIVAEGVKDIQNDSSMGVIVITHYQRLLNYLRPDQVHIMLNGEIVKSGGFELAEELEEKGYENIS